MPPRLEDPADLPGLLGQVAGRGMRRLLQDEWREYPWRVFVCCILLNQTSRGQVDRVVRELFFEYPTPAAMAGAGLRDVARLLADQGLQWIKAYRLVRMSDEFPEWDGSADTVQTVFGLGQYAEDSYRVFCLGYANTVIWSLDKELLAYQASLAGAA